MHEPTAIQDGRMLLAKRPERELFDMAYVCRVTGFHRSTIARRMASGTFPRSAMLDGKHYWRRRDVLLWINSLFKPSKEATR